mmetsp:Transcript_23827/g.77476  ORF Transcript_23827/g.77476 Transcript_23827/m.77476 type:complete len:252 (+) Transcript_23827:349-1104(+)
MNVSPAMELGLEGWVGDEPGFKDAEVEGDPLGFVDEEPEHQKDGEELHKGELAHLVRSGREAHGLKPGDAHARLHLKSARSARVARGPQRVLVRVQGCGVAREVVVEDSFEAELGEGPRELARAPEAERGRVVLDVRRPRVERHVLAQLERAVDTQLAPRERARVRHKGERLRLERRAPANLVPEREQELDAVHARGAVPRERHVHHVHLAVKIFVPLRSLHVHHQELLPKPIVHWRKRRPRHLLARGRPL